MKIIRLILRIIVGLVFIFSGIVKGIDPLGSAYKFHDYFLAFGLDFLQPYTLFLAILLCLAEFITGLSVLTAIRYREGITGMFIMIAFFTPLTLVLAISNPVSDCGCFGDAVHLTNWQTFLKNLVLFLLILVLFLTRRSEPGILAPGTAWITVSIASIIFVLFIQYNLRYLPLIDFLPYKIGNNLPELMEIPEDARPDIYETTFIYEKDGIRKEFTLDNYPAEDTTWKFIDQKSVLISKGYLPTVHDFSITNQSGDDITDLVLSNEDFTLLMIARKLELAKRERVDKGIQIGMKCMEKNIDFHILTASGADEIAALESNLDFCMTDETTLKTMVRSNPGYILLRKGTIIGKWSWANLPENLFQIIEHSEKPLLIKIKKDKQK